MINYVTLVDKTEICIGKYKFKIGKTIWTFNENSMSLKYLSKSNIII